MNKYKDRRTILWFLSSNQNHWWPNKLSRSQSRFSVLPSLGFFVMPLAILLTSCFGPNKVALSKQFDGPIGHNKDLLITELGLPTNECTPLKIGEACEWVQTGTAHYLEGPLNGTFPGDKLTYFIDSRGIVCQWRFLGARNGTQHSANRCQ